jgi:hypothetical protein
MVAGADTSVQKEVERRRRHNINEGIAELSRIVPNGAGEKIAVCALHVLLLVLTLV